MKRCDIIRRAFRGTGVGIDINGKEKQHLRFPGFETYEGPEADEEHNDDVVTEAEIKLLAKAEEKYQKEKKRSIKAEKKEAKRRRAIRGNH